MKAKLLTRPTHLQWAAILFCLSIAVLFAYFMAFIHIAAAIETQLGRAIFFTANLALAYSVVAVCWWAVRKLDKK